MQQNGRLPIGQAIFKGRFLYMLVLILMLIAIQPLDEAIGKYGILLDLITTAILVSSIYAISQKRAHGIAGVLLAVPLLVSLWLAYFFKNTWLQMSGNVGGIAFFNFYHRYHPEIYIQPG